MKSVTNIINDIISWSESKISIDYENNINIIKERIYGILF